MFDWLDGTLYPDVPPPASLPTLAERVDFLVRLCGAWDFGVLPELATITEVRKPEWRDAVDACCLLPSPAYHLLRIWRNLPALPYLGQRLATIADDPNLEYV